MKLLTNRAQMFADVRTCWSGEAVKRVTGYELEGEAKKRSGRLPASGRSGPVDASGAVEDAGGRGSMKPFWEMTETDIDACLKATMVRGGCRLLPGRQVFPPGSRRRPECPVTMVRVNLVKGVGPVVQLAEGWSVEIPEEVSDSLWKRTDYTWPCTWFAPRVTGEGVQERLRRDEQLGGEPWGHQLRACGRGYDHAVLDAADTGVHAQCTGGVHLPSGQLECLRDGQGGAGLPGVCGLWSTL